MSTGGDSLLDMGDSTMMRNSSIVVHNFSRSTMIFVLFISFLALNRSPSLLNIPLSSQLEYVYYAFMDHVFRSRCINLRGKLGLV